MPAIWETIADIASSLFEKAGADNLASKITPDFVKGFSSREATNLLKVVAVSGEQNGVGGIESGLQAYGAGGAGRITSAALRYALPGDPTEWLGQQLNKLGKAAEFQWNSKFYMPALGITQENLQQAAAGNEEPFLAAANLYSAISGNPVRRFAATTIKRFAIDTTNIMVIRTAQKLYDSTQTYQNETPTEQRLSNVFVASLAGSAVGNTLDQYKAGRPTLALEAPSQAATYAERVNENLAAARAHYGTAGPETLGSLIGGLSAFSMLNPHISTQVLARHVAVGSVQRAFANAQVLARQQPEGAAGPISAARTRDPFQQFLLSPLKLPVPKPEKE